MANGEHKPGYAIADRLRERHERGRRKFKAAMHEAFDEWEDSTDPEYLGVGGTVQPSTRSEVTPNARAWQYLLGVVVVVLVSIPWWGPKLLLFGEP